MHQMGLPDDQPIDAAVERRRSAEAARKARIFNSRLRVIGVDLDALNQQVQEKKHRQTMERQRDRAFDKMRETHDEALLQQDIDDREKRAAMHAGLTQYWATHQRVEDSRDADLKCGLKGAFSYTALQGELGPASMQIFQGEGTGEEQKRREQIKKTERDLRTQKEEKERKHMRDKHNEMLVTKELVHQDLRGVKQDALNGECKKATRVALDDYNRALAAERVDRLKEQHRREERENLAELSHTLTSDMMTECAAAAEIEVEAGQPPRVLTDRWKGMSPEQLHTIHREREAQRLERQRQRDAERCQKAAWDLRVLKASLEAEEQERRDEELRREKRIQINQYNMRLAREQREHHEYLSKKLYTNEPTKAYFNQFNTCSR